MNLRPGAAKTGSEQNVGTNIGVIVGMKNETYELLALVFFLIAGFFYLVAAIVAGDGLIIAGTLVWIGACALWLVPAIRRYIS